MTGDIVVEERVADVRSRTSDEQLYVRPPAHSATTSRRRRRLHGNDLASMALWAPTPTGKC